MTRRFRKCLVGDVLEEDVQLTLTEIGQLCRVPSERLIAMVDEGVIEPVHAGSGTWQFNGSNVKRVLTVIRLEAELGVNLAGAALAMELLDELRALKSQLQRQRLSEPLSDIIR